MIEEKKITILERVGWETEQDVQRKLRKIRDWILEGKHFEWSLEKDWEGNIICKRK